MTGDGPIETCCHGHIYEPGSFSVDARGHRRCRECQRLLRLERGLPASLEPLALTYDVEVIRDALERQRTHRLKEEERRRSLDEYYGYFEKRLIAGVLK